MPSWINRNRNISIMDALGYTDTWGQLSVYGSNLISCIFLYPPNFAFCTIEKLMKSECFPVLNAFGKPDICWKGIYRYFSRKGPLFRRCQVYDWPLFFKKKYMNDPIFLDFYVKGPTFLTSRYMHIFFCSEIFRGCLFSWYSMNFAIFV